MHKRCGANLRRIFFYSVTLDFVRDRPLPLQKRGKSNLTGVISELTGIGRQLTYIDGPLT